MAFDFVQKAKMTCFILSFKHITLSSHTKQKTQNACSVLRKQHLI